MCQAELRQPHNRHPSHSKPDIAKFSTPNQPLKASHLERITSASVASSYRCVIVWYRAQFTTFAMLTSPLILGNDPRNMTSCDRVHLSRGVSS